MPLIGSNNIALGFQAGSNVGTDAPGDDNIEIGNVGGGFDTGTIRIGDQAVQGACFIAGITTALTGPTAPVIINMDGQLGIPTSSRRFKKEIKPMDKTSEAILAFKPVTFRYKDDNTGTPQFGLIAEDVAKVNEKLIVRDKEGKPFSVRYDQVNAILLNEFLKEHKKVEQLQATVAQQQMDFQAAIAKLKEAFTAQLNEQAAQIQKVSAQLEANKVAPQMVLNSQ